MEETDEIRDVITLDIETAKPVMVEIVSGAEIKAEIGEVPPIGIDREGSRREKINRAVIGEQVEGHTTDLYRPREDRHRRDQQVTYQRAESHQAKR